VALDGGKFEYTVVVPKAQMGGHKHLWSLGQKILQVASVSVSGDFAKSYIHLIFTPAGGKMF